MKCYKKTHQVSLPGFIVGFVILMALTAMLSGCGASQPSDSSASNPSVSVETSAPEQTDAPASDAPVANTPETPETPIEDYDTPMSSPVANKPAPGLPSVAINSDTVIEAGDETVYNFRTEGFTGCLLDGSTRSYELYYGIHAEVNGSRLVYRAYSYDETIAPVEAMFMRDSTENYFEMDISLEDKSIDLSNQVNDAFTMFVTFSNDETCFMTVYVNDKVPYIVDSIYRNADYVEKYIMPKQDQLLALTEQFGVTPENSLGVTRKDISYPSADNYNYRCDTERWRDLAHDIVTDDTLPNSLKAAMLHDWMTENLSYDYYTVRECNSDSRWNVHRYDKNAGDWNVYTTHTGICRDFVNIYAIMCREFDIPCTTVENGRHTWNLIWLDGKWVDIDLTTDIKRAVYKEDVTDVSNADDTICYDAFMRDWIVTSIKNATIGKSIYTEKFVTTGKR